jgi:hypothetical protein
MLICFLHLYILITFDFPSDFLPLGARLEKFRFLSKLELLTSRILPPDKFREPL